MKKIKLKLDQLCKNELNVRQKKAVRGGGSYCWYTCHCNGCTCTSSIIPQSMMESYGSMRSVVGEGSAEILSWA